MQYTGDETRDGGQTPGPFEEMRRRMAESGLETPGLRKRKRKDKKRKWRWTIGDGEDSDAQTTPTTALERTPITSIWMGGEITNGDSTMLGNGNGNVEQETISKDGNNNAPSDETLRMSRKRISLGNFVGGRIDEGNDDRDRRTQSVELFTDSEMSEEGSERPGSSHSL